MGSIDIIKFLSTVLSTTVNQSQQHHQKNYWESRESKPTPLGAKQERYPSCYAVPCADCTLQQPYSLHYMPLGLSVLDVTGRLVFPSCCKKFLSSNLAFQQDKGCNEWLKYLNCLSSHLPPSKAFISIQKCIQNSKRENSRAVSLLVSFLYSSNVRHS